MLGLVALDQLFLSFPPFLNFFVSPSLGLSTPRGICVLSLTVDLVVSRCLPEYVAVGRPARRTAGIFDVCHSVLLVSLGIAAAFYFSLPSGELGCVSICRSPATTSISVPLWFSLCTSCYHGRCVACILFQRHDGATWEQTVFVANVESQPTTCA